MRGLLAPVLAVLLLLSGCGQVPGRAAGRVAGAGYDGPPAYDHVVVVVFENKSLRRTRRHAPYLMGLARSGVLLTRSYGVAHPSQPNYFALFSGRRRVRDDRCPVRRRGDHLAAQLERSGLSFAAYSEDLPRRGAMACEHGRYRRRHAPWVSFTTFDQRDHRPLRQLPRRPRGFAHLPTVSFVVPDMCHDMHDCPVRAGDRWLERRLGRYVRWARRHDSLLVVTFDEDDHTDSNRIMTVLAGAHLQPGRSRTHLDHYGLLRTLEAMHSLPALGRARRREPLTGVWD